MSLFTALMPTRFMRPPRERRAFHRDERGSSWAGAGAIDHFRAYQDIYGRRYCEDALVRMRAALDRAAHGRARIEWRGDSEFVAVMAGGSLEGAVDLADDLRMAAEALQIPHQASPLGIVTLSLGVAPLAADGEEAKRAAIARAKDALERAQMSGPNRVLAAGLALA